MPAISASEYLSAVLQFLIDTKLLPWLIVGIILAIAVNLITGISD